MSASSCRVRRGRSERRLGGSREGRSVPGPGRSRAVGRAEALFFVFRRDRSGILSVIDGLEPGGVVGAGTGHPHPGDPGQAPGGAVRPARVGRGAEPDRRRVPAGLQRGRPGEGLRQRLQRHLGRRQRRRLLPAERAQRQPRGDADLAVAAAGRPRHVADRQHQRHHGPGRRCRTATGRGAGAAAVAAQAAGQRHDHGAGRQHPGADPRRQRLDRVRPLDVCAASSGRSPTATSR